MKKIAIVFSLFVLFEINVNGLNLPGPLVYVVTPSPHSPGADKGRSAPFYYHNWIKRIDSPQNVTTTISTPKLKVKTPDLIFAEFESDNSDNMKKSIRKLLEKEKTEIKTSTTMGSIYVPDEDINRNSHKTYETTTEKMEEKSQSTSNDMTDYFALYNNLYNNDPPAPVYISSTMASSSTTTTAAPADVENVWHIIDSEKYNQYSGKWNEIPITSETNQDTMEDSKTNSNKETYQQKQEDNAVDENFALPGFGTNPGNGAENESRAIRTEQNIRFPYVSLKPFQMKNLKKPLSNIFTNSKKGNNNMFTSLDNFQEIKNPVRGEAQDIDIVRQPIERYNPAQPYLPHDYGSKSKQSSPIATPMKTVANLVPPPPPPPPKLTADDFPSPTNYESFPPYAVPTADSVPMVSSPAVKPTAISYQPPAETSNDSEFDAPPTDSDNDDMSMALGYRYKPPAFVPTLPSVKKPYDGYSYDKPLMAMDTPPTMNTGGYSYNKPAMSLDSPTVMNMGTYNKPDPTMDSMPEDKPDFHGYNYNKPPPVSPPEDHAPFPTYGYHDHGPPSYHHESDYPELIFDKPHGGMDDSKNGGDTKGGDDTKDIGMMPPPPQPQQDMKPDMDSSSMDDHGFPHDFPGDLKYHDFDDHDFYHHHHHHHTTTTTTTTEMPRVNRYSYYYLGKKLYYLPLYFSVYFIVYVGALIIKAILRHKIVYPNSWRPNDQTASFFSKRSVDSWNFSNETLHEVTGRVTRAIAKAAEKYMTENTKVDK
ncbi:uncharacterized protein LOC113518553 [Galleria mellonella]|uniref:Uncharacterized protein LOC113518553 n=1 Tax=Galleria mellonella TaxID=7137 RepID=A0ABM3N502_GALME|nr:uncharacterized protein LOC113518553 [Galleria mellonella]